MKCSKCGHNNDSKNHDPQPAIIQKDDVGKGKMNPVYPNKDKMYMGKDMNAIYKKIHKFTKIKPTKK